MTKLRLTIEEVDGKVLKQDIFDSPNINRFLNWIDMSAKGACYRFPNER